MALVLMTFRHLGLDSVQIHAYGYAQKVLKASLGRSLTGPETRLLATVIRDMPRGEWKPSRHESSHLNPLSK